MTRAVVIGQSHSVAIQLALAGECANVDGIVVHRIGSRTRPDESDTVDDDRAMKIAAQVAPDVAVFLSLLGTHHNLLGLLRSGPDFDFLASLDDVPDPSAIVRIPHRAIATVFKEYLEDYPVLDELVETVKAPLFLLSPPPPKQSNDFMLSHFMRRDKRMKYGKSVQAVGIERPESRLKLWRLETALMATWAQARGVGFVPAPAECFNEEGYLARKFYFDDATHANAEYGGLVLQQIMSISEKMRKKAAHA